MDNVRYTAKRLGEILGATPKQVEAAVGRRDGFTPEHLPALREKLRRRPEPFPARVQLFLNFKGGTGKTSVSTSYAYRLAERGYRVLMLDLDSQGHATKCLGKEGGSFERTLHDVLIRKTPLDEVTIATAMPGLSLVPANLAIAPSTSRSCRSPGASSGSATRSRGSRPATTSW
jgi:chromosome partitioning protein